MEERLNFHEFELDPANGILTRNGERIPLQPQPMRVLVILASRAGNLVSRRELQGAVWPDGTFVDFDQGLNWCIRRIREVLGDDATNPRFIETVPRKGYRFIAAATRENDTAKRPRKLALAAAVVALVALGFAMHRDRDVTIVVLPFDNFTGESSNAIAADLATEEVINRVGSIDPRRIKVIDRMTAAKFKRTGECIIHVGKQLHADFVMEGSLQKSRTTAALYRVADNTQVWATAAGPHADSAAAVIAAKVAATFD